MSQTEKAFYFNGLKAQGITFDKHYREYSTEELRSAYAPFVEAGEAPEYQAPAPQEQPASAPEPPQPQPQSMADLAGPPPPVEQPKLAPPRERQGEELPGERLNQKTTDEIIEVDENGLQWIQKEVRKPATAKPRGRRVLTYTDTGTKTVTTPKQQGEGAYTETFEVPGDGQPVTRQVKITLPSYQVGIYRDPRYPFKVYVYNEKRGFDFFEVCEYYGGAESVPEGCKRTYVENVLVFDMRSVIRTINEEYRQLSLTGRIR